jgi:hypothetical protein
MLWTGKVKIQLDSTHMKFIQCVASSLIITVPSFTMHGHMNVKFALTRFDVNFDPFDIFS